MFSGATTAAQRRGSRRAASADARPRAREPRAEPRPLGDLHWLAAGLLLSTAFDAALGDPQAARGEANSHYRKYLKGARWAPLALAPIAGAAHVAHALQPSRLTYKATQIANGLAIGAGAAAIVGSAAAALRDRDLPPGWRPGRGRIADWLTTLAPIAFVATGVLGILLSRAETD